MFAGFSADALASRIIDGKQIVIDCKLTDAGIHAIGRRSNDLHGQYILFDWQAGSVYTD